MKNIAYPLLIDGGLSNVLEARGCQLNHQLWHAHLLENNPEEIIEAHCAYIRAGAQCITTASYQASIPGFMQMGCDKTKAEALILKSVLLAEIAIERSMDAFVTNTKPLIAASIGPYGAYLADGSEYRGHYRISNDKLREFHLDRIKLLDSSHADILACETIPSYQEAQVLSDLLAEVQKPAWISFSCRDEGHINDGTSIEQCVALLTQHPQVFAIGVNCTAPRYISSLIQRISVCAGDKKILVYPNSGEVYHAHSKSWSEVSAPVSYIDMVKQWLSLGADIIGGCCRIGPEHIRAISTYLENNKEKISQ